MSKSNQSLEQIAYIKNLIEKATPLQVAFYTASKENLFATPFINNLQIDKWLFPQNKRIPKIKGNLFSINYHIEEDFIGTFIAIANNTIPFDTLIHQAILVYNLIYHISLTYEDVVKENFYQEPFISDLEIQLSEDFTHIRIDDYIQENFSSLHYERELLSCVKHGNTNELLAVLEKIPPLKEEDINHLSETPLQAMKTRMIMLLVLATRSALMGGLPTALAFKLNTYYLKQLDRLNTIKEVDSFLMMALIDLTHRVDDKAHTNMSRPVLDATFYIIKNLYSDMTPITVCQALHFNPSYLARLFKKEMNLTLSEFIMQERIEEAKRLLLVSNHSILEIATLLHFTDQSHFTRNFKKLVHVTPKVYRNQYKILS